MGYNQRYKSINLCPEPCAGEGGVWNRWLNIPPGSIAPITISDSEIALYTQAINTTIQPSGGQWTLRGNFTVSDDVGGGSFLTLIFDFGALNTYSTTLEIPAGEDENNCEFELIVEDLEGSSRLSRLLIWVRGRLGGTEPVEISLPDLPFGATPQPDYNLIISGIISGNDVTFTWTSLLGENFTLPS